MNPRLSILVKFLLAKAKPHQSTDFVPEIWLRDFFSGLSPQTKAYISSAFKDGDEIKKFYLQMIGKLRVCESESDFFVSRSNKPNLDHYDSKRDEGVYEGKFGVYTND